MGRHESPAGAARPARRARAARLRAAVCFGGVFVAAGVAGELLTPPGFFRWALSGFLFALALAAVTAVPPRWFGRGRRGVAGHGD